MTSDRVTPGGKSSRPRSEAGPISEGAISEGAASQKAALDESAAGRATSEVVSAVADEALPRKRRICHKRDFKQVFTQGRRVSEPALRLVFCRSDRPYSRLGLAVSRKVSKRAVDRNRIKRSLREIFRRNPDAIPDSIDVVAVVQPPMRHFDHAKIREVFLGLMVDCRRRFLSTDRRHSKRRASEGHSSSEGHRPPKQSESNDADSST